MDENKDLHSFKYKSAKYTVFLIDLIALTISSLTSAFAIANLSC